jgi:hypothetical protein
MSLSQKEIDLLNAAYQIFVGRTHIFNVLSTEKWQNTGMENWVQTELTVGLLDRDYDVSTTGKIARHCDLIVKNKSLGLDVGIEIKAFTCSYAQGCIDGIKKHPTQLYLFVIQYDENDFNYLKDYLDKKKYCNSNDDDYGDIFEIRNFS